MLFYSYLHEFLSIYGEDMLLATGQGKYYHHQRSILLYSTLHLPA